MPPSQPDNLQPGNPDDRFDWRAAVAEHERWLRLVVLARLGEPDAVGDVMQDVAIAAARGAGRLRDPSRAAAWLYQIAVSQSLEHRRRAGRRRRRLEAYRQQRADRDAWAPPENDPLDWLLAEEQRRLVRRAIAALPPRDAEMLLLKYTQDWTYAQLAERLGVSEPAAVGRLHRARAKLRAALRREDPTLGQPAAATTESDASDR